jgi:hypothetical protein
MILDIERKPGIYFIKNKISEKIYIGSSVNMKRRLTDHFARLKAKTHHSKHLQSAFNKYGEEQFYCGVIEEVEEANLLIQEKYWCDKYKARDREHGYNTVDILNTERRDPIVTSLAARRKISELHKGKIPKNLESIRKLILKPVELYVKGELIGKYESQRSASRILNINYHAINNQVKGYIKNIRGYPDYIFKYSTIESVVI